MILSGIHDSLWAKQRSMQAVRSSESQWDRAVHICRPPSEKLCSTKFNLSTVGFLSAFPITQLPPCLSCLSFSLHRSICCIAKILTKDHSRSVHIFFPSQFSKDHVCITTSGKDCIIKEEKRPEFYVSNQGNYAPNIMLSANDWLWQVQKEQPPFLKQWEQLHCELCHRALWQRTEPKWDFYLIPHPCSALFCYPAFLHSVFLQKNTVWHT